MNYYNGIALMSIYFHLIHASSQFMMEFTNIGVNVFLLANFPKQNMQMTRCSPSMSSLKNASLYPEKELSKAVCSSVLSQNVGRECNEAKFLLHQVYGSDHIRATALREFQGGRLKTSMGDPGFLPYNGKGPGGVDGIGIAVPNSQNAGSHFYVAGDVRANEVTHLIAWHALWLREHNKV